MSFPGIIWALLCSLGFSRTLLARIILHCVFEVLGKLTAMKLEINGPEELVVWGLRSGRCRAVALREINIAAICWRSAATCLTVSTKKNLTKIPCRSSTRLNKSASRSPSLRRRCRNSATPAWTTSASTLEGLTTAPGRFPFVFKPALRKTFFKVCRFLSRATLASKITRPILFRW